MTKDTELRYIEMLMGLMKYKNVIYRRDDKDLTEIILNILDQIISFERVQREPEQVDLMLWFHEDYINHTLQIDHCKIHNILYDLRRFDVEYNELLKDYRVKEKTFIWS